MPVRCQRTERQDGARRPDDALKPSLDDLPDERAGLSADVPFQPALVPARDRIALCKPLGQPDRTEFEAAAELHARGRTERDLRAAAADVDDDGGPRADADCVDRRLMNQPGFLGAGNHASANADIALDGGDEVRAVGRLAHGAGGGGNDFVHAVRFGQASEFRQRLHGDRDARVGQDTAFEAARTEPDHVLFAVDDLKRQIGSNAAHDHVDGIGPDIDRRNAHALQYLYKGIAT